MATLAKLLQVDMGLPDMAKRLAASGRRGDTILAHINPKEAKLLKKQGGSGKINPYTGIMEFAYGEDDNAGEAEAQQYQQNAAAAEPVQSYAPAAQDPAQRLESAGAPPSAPVQEPSQGAYLPSAPEAPHLTPAAIESAVASPGYGINASAQKAVPLANVPNVGAGAYQAPAVPIAPSTAVPSAPPSSSGQNLMSTLTGGAKDLSGLLSAAAPLAKLGMAGVGAVQANQQSQQAQQQAAVNEAEIRKLAEPYRQQGQQLVELGKAGGLTAPQQQALEVQRAQAMQQQANAGITGGTAAQQTEANLARQASIYAQDNVNQGMKLMGVADTYIKDAINTGYLQSKDAMAISSDFYKQLGLMFPDATSQANAAPK
jgi:hypothetical protein